MIRAKLTLAIVGVAAALACGSVVAVSHLLQGGFLTIEERELRSELVNLDAAIGHRFESLDAQVTDWAMWGDCHDWFSNGQDPAFIERLATAAFMEESGVDAIMLMNRDGVLLDGRVFSEDRQRVVVAGDAMHTALARYAPMLSMPNERSAVHGLIDVDGEPWMMAVRPSLDDAGGGPISGVVLMARRLDARFLLDLSHALDREITVQRRDAIGDLENWSAAQQQLETGNDLPVVVIDDSQAAGYVSLFGISGETEWLVRMTAPRTVWLQGRQEIRAVVLTLLAAIGTAAVVLWLLIDRAIGRRLNRAGLQVLDLATGADRLEEAGNDELTHIAKALNLRLADLSEMKGSLASAREDSAHAIQTKADLLAAVSHELRNPLNGIIGSVRLLMNADLPPDERELIEVTRSSADGLLAVVNDLLDVSRLEAGKLELETLVFDPRTVVEEAVLQHAEQAQGSGVQFAPIVDASIPRHISGDPGRLRQIIHNLAGNAVKFTSRGEIVLQLLPFPEGSGPRHIGLRLVVRDTGSGIPKAVQDRLFDRISMNESSTSRRAAGSGLGLTISKRLAERMGGGMKLDCKPHQGSTVEVTMVLGRIDATPASDPLVAMGDQRRILVVDSHAPTREGVRHVLRGIGFEVDEAADVDNARLLMGAGGQYRAALVSDSLIDASPDPQLVVDLLNQALPDLPLIIMAPLASRIRYTQVKGPIAILSKPVRRIHLREALLRHVGVTGVMRSPADPEGDSSRSHTDMQVLVVDDSHINQRVAAGMLKRLGCTVDLAGNGLEGLEALRRRRYDLMVLDCQMPVMDGYTLAEQWRREEDQDRRLLIVALTADATTGARDRCLSAGMDDYLVKPIDFDALATTVRRAISRRSDGSGKLPALSDPERVRPPTGELDKDLLGQVRILGDEGFRKVIDRYLEAMPERLDRLAKALQNGDHNQVGVVAHQMVGESGLVGLRRVEQLARDIELAARSENRLLDSHMPTLREAFTRGKELLLVARDEPAPG